MWETDLGAGSERERTVGKRRVRSMFDIQNTKYGTVYAIRVARIPDVTISFYVMYFLYILKNATSMSNIARFRVCVKPVTTGHVIIVCDVHGSVLLTINRQQRKMAD